MSLPNGNYVLAAPRSFIYADIASRNPVDDGPFQGRKIGQHLFQVQSYPTTPTTYTIMHIESGQYVASDPVSKQVVLASKGSLASNLKWNFTSLPGTNTYTISNVMSSVPLVAAAPPANPPISLAITFVKVPADNASNVLLQQEIANHQRDNTNNQNTINSLQSSLTTLQNTINGLRRDLSTRDTTINQLRADIVNLNNTISSNTATIKSLNSKMKVRGKTAAQWEAAARQIFRNGQATITWQASNNGVNQANKVYWSKGFTKLYG